MARLHTRATVFSSSGGVTCESFPSVCGFGILYEMSQPKSYTGIVGGSIIRRRKLSIAWAACRTCGMLQDRLEAARLFLGHISIYRKTQ